MCKQAERDQEARKLAFLMDRVKRQIAERDNTSTTKRPVIAINSEAASSKLPSRSALFER